VLVLYRRKQPHQLAAAVEGAVLVFALRQTSGSRAPRFFVGSLHSWAPNALAISPRITRHRLGPLGLKIFLSSQPG
jgi:hypothetical protein